MFIGWIRRESIIDDLDNLKNFNLIDKESIIQNIDKNPLLTFGIYQNELLVALISAYQFEKSTYINHLYYKKELLKSHIDKLVNLVIKNSSLKNIIFMASKNELEKFLDIGFNKYSKFKKAIYGTKRAVFNFSSNMAKSINNKEYMKTIKKVDILAYEENRVDFIKSSTQRASSLILSTKLGYQHSYSLDKNIIKISPWIVQNSFEEDSEKMIRGLIYNRGLKKLIAIIPSNEDGIVNLYKSYNFDIKDDYYLLYYGSKPNIKTNMIYAF